MALPLLLLLLLIAPGVARAQTPTPEEQDPLEPVPARISAAEDEAIALRLREVFGRLEDLRSVQVEVGSGVVRLSGTTVSADARQQAGRLARQVQGVLAVDNRIEVVRDLRRRLDTVMDRLEDRFYVSLASLPLLVVALALVWAAWLVGTLLGRWPALYRRLTRNPFLADLLRQGVRTVLVLVGILGALELLEATTLVGAILGTAGLLGVALGFAFRDLVENSIASVLLSLRQPFSPNDLVRIDDFEGRVVRLNSRATILLTLDGNHVRIPNAQVYKGIIVNYTRNPRRRFTIEVGVGTGEDLRRAQAAGVEALRNVPGVLSEPPPFSEVGALGDWTVSLRFLGWVDQRRNDYFKVRSEATRLLKEGLDCAGVSMPEPTYRILSPAPEPEQPRRPIPADESPADVSVEDHLAREVEDERQAPGVRDLLDPAAPKE